MSRIGTYDIIETLGDGPHGPAYLAMDPVLGKTMVLKSLESLAGADVELDQALTAVFGVSSPWVLRTQGCGRSGKTPFVIRDYVNGVDLQRLREAVRVFELPFALGIVSATAQGVAAFHLGGTAHGNLRLSNILLTRTGELRVADPAVFARVAPFDAAGLASGRFGALPLLPPERLEGSAPAPADDIFALGALAYWLLTDSWPFPVAEPARMVRDMRSRIPVLPEEVPQPIRALVTACLAPAPADRPRSGAEVQRTLEAYASAHELELEDALADGLASRQVAFIGGRDVRRAPPAAYAMDMPARSEAPGRADPVAPPRGGPAPALFAKATPVADNDAVAPPAGRNGAAPPRPKPLPKFGDDPPMLDVKNVDHGSTSERGEGTPWVAGVMALALIGGMVWYGTRDKTAAPVSAGSETAAAAPTDGAIEAALNGAEASPDEALRLALVAVRELPGSGPAQLLLAKALLRKERFAEAAQAALLASERMPESVDAQRTAVAILTRAGRHTDAVARASLAVERHGADALFQLVRGRALRQDHQIDAAADAFSLTVQLDPDLIEGWLEVGAIELERGRWQQSRDAFQRAIGLDGKNGPAYAGLGQALLGLGRGGEAVDTLKRGLSVATDPNAVRYAVGWVLLRDGRTEEALPYVTAHAADNPTDARSQFAAGVTLLRLGRLGEATDALRKSVELDRESAETWFNLAVGELALGRSEEAVKAFRSATERRFGLWQAHCERGRLLYQLGRRDEGRDDLKIALELQPKLAVAEGLLNVQDGTTTADLIAGVPCGPSTLLPDG